MTPESSGSGTPEELDPTAESSQSSTDTPDATHNGDAMPANVEAVETPPSTPIDGSGETSMAAVDSEKEIEAEPAVEAETSAEVEPEVVNTEPVVEAEANVEAETEVVAAEPAVEAETSAEVEAAEPAVEAEANVEAVPEDVAAESEVEAEVGAEGEPEISMEALLEQGPEVPKLQRGDLLEGTVTSTSPTSVLVDIGGKAEAIIPGRELERMNRQTLETLQPGNAIPVYVVNPHDHQGNVILSVNRALEELDWREAETYRESREVYETQVAGYNKGGLIVRFGRVRGFVPQSQLSPDRIRLMTGETPEERWGGMVNDHIAVKVLEVDRSRNRLILSERAASRESREKRKESLINDLREGEVRSGRVVSLEDFGAFIDIGGAEGLVHLTELAWQHVTHPREMLKIGQEVQVEVISVDTERKRIGLSLKSQEPDPWDEVAADYNEGQLVQGVVTKLTKFGAFAKLVDAPAIEGLIHISELSEQRVNHPREVLEIGDKLTLRVIKVDIVNRRLGMSLKRVNSAEYLDIDWDAGAP